MRVLGLDLSLSCTGLCLGGVCDTVKPGRMVGMVRLHHLRSEILQAADGCDLVVVEGYAMGTARQAGSYSIGELGGLIRYALWVHDIPYVEVPPATLKLFATGKGNAGKDQMVATAARLGCPADDNNAVDAWMLYQMALYAARVDPGRLPVTVYRDRAVSGIEWWAPSLAAGLA